MSRAARLLDLAQTLRRRRAPVSGEELARELGVSLRTLYRDIATLRAQGADIEGAAGLGFVLRPGFALPPLMFDESEIDALALGLRFVEKQGDPALVAAAGNALAKIAAVLPPDRAEALGAAPLVAGPRLDRGEATTLAALRPLLAQESKIEIAYEDASGAASRRVVWPVAVAFFDGARILAAWCELRGDFRHFRLDRILEMRALPDRPPQRRAVLMARWRASLKPPADRN